jgi:hypothetical protein
MLQYIIAEEIRVPPQAIPFAIFVDKVAVGQVTFRVHRFPSVSIIPSVPHTNISLIYHRRCIILLETDSVFY